MAEFEVREIVSASRKRAVQPVPILMLARTHPLFRLCDKGVRDSMRHDIPFHLAWLPVTQSVLLRMDEMDITLTDWRLPAAPQTLRWALQLHLVWPRSYTQGTRLEGPAR